MEKNDHGLTYVENLCWRRMHSVLRFHRMNVGLKSDAASTWSQAKFLPKLLREIPRRVSWCLGKDWVHISCECLSNPTNRREPQVGRCRCGDNDLRKLWWGIIWWPITVLSTSSFCCCICFSPSLSCVWWSRSHSIWSGSACLRNCRLLLKGLFLWWAKLGIALTGSQRYRPDFFVPETPNCLLCVIASFSSRSADPQHMDSEAVVVLEREPDDVNYYLWMMWTFLWRSRYLTMMRGWRKRRYSRYYKSVPCISVASRCRGG